MAAKPSSDMIIEDNEIDELDQQDDNYQAVLEEEKKAKKELKPGQKAVVVRRRIEDYLERKWMRDYYGVEVEQEE